MKLSSFMEMWKKDGFELTEHERIKNAGHTWVLLTAYCTDRTYDYGRHFGLTLALDSKEDIVAHDMLNLVNSSNPTSDTIEWFKDNVAAGVP